MSLGLSRSTGVHGSFRARVMRHAARVSRVGGTWALVTGGTIALASCGGDSGTGLQSEKVAREVVNIVFTPAADTVEVQKTSKITALCLDATGVAIDPSSTSRSWSIADSTIATIGQDGTVTGVRIGVTTATLKCDSLSRPVGINVVPPPAVSITFPTTSFTLTEGDTLTLPTPRIVDRNGAVVTTRRPTYTSSSPNLVVVPPGFVTAVTAGTATITAQLDTAHATLSFTILPAPIGKMKLIPAVLDLGVGHTIATQASSYSLNGQKLTGRKYTYTIDKPSVATVSATGVVSGVGAGKATLTVATGTGSLQIPVSVATLQTNGFTIDLRFVGNVSTTVRQAAMQAAARWQQVISAPLIPYHIVVGANECGPGIPAIDTTETNMMIIVQADSIDGRSNTVGEGGPCVIRDDSPQETALGTLTIDTADVAGLAAQGILVGTITHEMGHILGIGTLWDGVPSYAGLATGLGGPNPVFVGHAARVAAAELGFTADSSLGVPIENTGTVGDGTRDSHWRASVFGHELMTGTIHNGLNPLSLVTIETLGDFGYTVVPEAADDFDVANATNPGGVVQPSETIGTQMRETLRFPQFTVTRTGRLKPIPGARPPEVQP